MKFEGHLSFITKVLVKIFILRFLNILNNSLEISSSSTGRMLDNASITVETLRETIKKLTGIRARLGATQSRLARAINTQLSAAENLSAAGATMKDADLASEFANLTKESILVQSSSAMIGQANLFPHGVIQLLP